MDINLIIILLLSLIIKNDKTIKLLFISCIILYLFKNIYDCFINNNKNNKNKNNNLEKCKILEKFNDATNQDIIDNLTNINNRYNLIIELLNPLLSEIDKDNNLKKKFDILIDNIKIDTNSPSIATKNYINEILLNKFGNMKIFSLKVSYKDIGPGYYNNDTTFSSNVNYIGPPNYTFSAGFDGNVGAGGLYTLSVKPSFDRIPNVIVQYEDTVIKNAGQNDISIYTIYFINKEKIQILIEETSPVLQYPVLNFLIIV
jgi:hypothetical protein